MVQEKSLRVQCRIDKWKDFGYVHLCGGQMTCRERFDTVPGFKVREQLFTYIFSEPQNTIPSFTAVLFEHCRREHRGETIPMPAPILHENQVHRVILKITKKPLEHDIEAHDAGDYLDRLHAGYFSTFNYFLTAETINLLLHTATRNYLEAKGRAKAVNSGLLFTRKLLAGEKLYMLIFFLSPTPRGQIETILKAT